MRRGKRQEGVGALDRRSGERTGVPRRSRQRATSDEPSSEEAHAAGHGGLQDFDLGFVPASVTPPRSSRHAAWFVIATSALAFGGLVTAAHVLVDQPAGPAIAEAPPFPRGDFDASPQRDRAASPLREEGDVLSFRGHDSDDRSSEADPSTPVRHPHSRVEAGAPAPPSSASDQLAQPGSTPQSTPAPTPPMQTPPPSVPSDEDERQPVSVLSSSLTQRTELYFAHLCAGETRAAFELTTGKLREHGYTAFIEHHPTTSCEITAVEAHSSTTLATIRMPEPDGSTWTQQRELSFTADSPPSITSDVPVR